MRRLIFILASIVVSIAFLILALRDVDGATVIASIQAADPLWVLLSIVMISFGMWTRGIRWRGLLDFKPSVLQAGHILNIGFMLNLLPLRVGEVARSLLITRAGVPVVTAATSVVVERLVDTLLVVIGLVIAIIAVPNVPDSISRPTILFGIAVVIAFATLLTLAHYPALAHRIISTVEGLLPFVKRLGLSSLLEHMLDGLKPLTHLRSGLYAVSWTLIAWSCSFFTLYALVRALNMTDPSGVPLTENARLLVTLLGLCLASLSIAIPTSVAGLGPFQLAILAAGTTGGASNTDSISLGFLFHGINILGYCLWGIVGMISQGVSLSDVFNRDQPPTGEQG